MDTKYYFGLTVILAIIAGFLFPQMKFFAPYLLILLGVLIWFSCLDISPQELLNSLKKPKQHLTLLLILFVLAPIICWLIVLPLNLPPAIIAGYVLAAMTPMAAATTFYTKILKGKTELSIAFTGISYLITPIAIPLLSFLLLRTYVKVDIFSMAKILLLVIVIPLLLAFITRKFKILGKMRNIVSIPVMFVILSTIIAMSSGNFFNKYTLILLLLAIFHCSINFILGYTLSRNWKYEDRIPLIFGATIRNMALILTLALIYFGSLAALPNAFILIVQVFFFIAILFFWKK